ncbi:MAG: TIM barrel protein, partial [Eubacteriales bacterium]|nr:TIM barrel protein [Eubacteriales bacterium]
MNKRPITICSGQFGDLSAEALCRTMHDIGYEGLEIATQSHIDVERIVSDAEYRRQYVNMLSRYELRIGALSGHLPGQCVGDRYDPRLDNFAPAKAKGNPEAIRAWAVQRMKTIAEAARILDVKVVTCFLGSPIWAYWYSFPQTTPEMVENGFQTIKELWSPIFDEYDRCGVKLALEVHPTEIA